MLIGFIITGFGIGLLFYVNNPQYTIIASVLSLLGLFVIALTTSYFLLRRWGISQAKSQEETSFRDWVYNHHGMKLSQEQTDQLYNYGTTVVQGVTYFTQKEFTENGDTRILIAKEEPTELLETGVLILPDLAN